VGLDGRVPFLVKNRERNDCINFSMPVIISPADPNPVSICASPVGVAPRKMNKSTFLPE